MVVDTAPGVTSFGITVLRGVIEPSVDISGIDAVVAVISDEAVLTLLCTSIELLVHSSSVQSDEGEAEEATVEGEETV